MQNVGATLAAIEEKYNLKPDEVAECLGMPKGTYNKFRLGHYNIRVSHWQRIALDFLLAEGPRRYQKIRG